MKTNNPIISVPKKELPPALEKTLKQATRYEWITIAYLISVTTIMFITMQSSQAMKAAWLEDTLSLLPAVFFLVARKFYDRPPNSNFPFGYHRVFSIAFQLGAFALLALGLFLLYDSVVTLIKEERPTIGIVNLFGSDIWMGWVMIAALLWSAIPAMILGRKKMPLAEALHNKILFTDAHTQRADWQTAFAAIIGVIGVGFGLWWADAAAACFISISIIQDGVARLKGAVLDLIDQVPTDLKNKEQHPVVAQVYAFFRQQPWVKDVRIRMREAGEIFFTEVFVIPVQMTDILNQTADAVNKVKKIDWKLHDVAIILVERFDDDQRRTGKNK